MVGERIWRISIEWPYRKDRILFYWSIVVLSVLVAFSAIVMVFDCEMHVRAVAGLTLLYLMRRLIGRMADPKRKEGVGTK
jgi:Na+/H+ antiporter NhaD/arsenite permease-like protein